MRERRVGEGVGGHRGGDRQSTPLPPISNNPPGILLTNLAISKPWFSLFGNQIFSPKNNY